VLISFAMYLFLLVSFSRLLVLTACFWRNKDADVMACALDVSGVF